MMAGAAMPEQGPNMMWNTKYSSMGGMMGSHTQSTPATITVSPIQAKALAQQYLDNNLPGKQAESVDTYYGYYNVDVVLNGTTYGMLSINDFTGQAWYHTWHGTYIQTATLSS